MSLPYAFFIMIVAGVLGGSVNFLLPDNENAETRQKRRGLFQCIILGFGATFLVPLFLEIAQSKLLDNMHVGMQWVKDENILNANIDSVNKSVTTLKDTINRIQLDTINSRPPETTHVTSNEANSTNSPLAEESNPLKGYLLYGAYCLLAAAAGFRFINMLINNVVKEQELNEKNNKIEALEKDKEKRVKNSQISQQQEDLKVREELVTDSIQQDLGRGDNQLNTLLPVLPVLPPITNPDDPQKGRFGGKSEVNYRRLDAEVTKSNIPEFYNVKIWVESTDPKNYPLNNDVIFYIHDSFNPSVFTCKVNEFKDGKALEEDIISYGAFTVGAIVANEQTMLELDLSEISQFPKKFRMR